MIRRAVIEDVPRLKQIWANCFLDNKEYIDFYYQHRFSEVETYVYEKNEDIVSMLTLVTAQAVKETSYMTVKYIYAVATDPSFQKQGIAKELLCTVCHEQEEQGIPLFLVPATESLFLYYKKCGFVTTTDQAIVELEASQFMERHNDPPSRSSSLVMKCLTAKAWDQARESSFRKNGYVRWDLKGLAYLLKEWEFTHGIAWEVNAEEMAGAILFYVNPSDHHLFIKEAAMPTELFNRIILKLIEEFRIQKIKYISSEKMTNTTKYHFAMSNQNGWMSTIQYVNFVKD